MAFNWKTFKTRTLTAIIFAAVMLTGLLWNQWSFLVLFSIIHFGCWWEYLNLLEKIYKTTYHRYTRIGFMLIGYGIMILFCSHTFQINNYQLSNFPLPVSIAGFVMLALGIFQTKYIKIKAFGIAALGLFYISLTWGMMVDLNHYSIKISYANHLPPFPFGGFNPTGLEYKWNVPLLIIAAIWINDTMAYIIGSLIGKTPLSKVSPKKTWEGTIGAIILAVGVSILIAAISDFNIFLFALTTFICVLTGTFGDLFESKLKRMANVKDSGKIMPGHGGFLDRFDSLLLATPAVWLFVYILYSTI
jgi:phosphatidate cytidylyltransferase